MNEARICNSFKEKGPEGGETYEASNQTPVLPRSQRSYKAVSSTTLNALQEGGGFMTNRELSDMRKRNAQEVLGRLQHDLINAMAEAQLAMGTGLKSQHKTLSELQDEIPKRIQRVLDGIENLEDAEQEVKLEKAFPSERGLYDRQ